MSGPHVYLSWPTAFSLYPESIRRPYPLPPPVNERSIRAPVGINKALFFNALRWQIPVLFGTAYILVVLYFNGLNKRRAYKPWNIAYKKSFRNFVVAHNVMLSVYSFVTFAAMARAIVHVWPGLHNDAGAAGIADALCKMHGPRGLGDAATYNATTNIFEVKNTLIKMGYDGNPDPTDVGRLWNEGLAFWGWLFYMSKFYEVIDTAIILAKGKRSPTLQTYHHSGAMLCMWAGIRYMSPPIWMFVFINSFIHGWMYIYYALSAVNVRVPRRYKQLLTSLQIAQIIFGASYATAHLFIQYDIPVSTPYQIVDTVRKAASSVSSAASAASTAVSSFVESPTITASMGALVKKLLLRAAGEEGVAERVHNDRGELLTPHMADKIEHFNEHTYQTRWRTDWTKVNCIDTRGEAFAIYINLCYLAPLAWLFGRFFVRAYTQRGKPRTATDAAKQISSSARDAARRTNDAVEKAGEKAGEKVVDGAKEVKKQGRAAHEQMREDLQMMRDGKFVNEKKTSQRMESVRSTAQEVVEDLKKEASDFTSGAQDVASKVSSSARDFASSTESSMAKAADEVQKRAPEAKKTAEDISASTKASIQEAADEVQKRAPEVKKTAEDISASTKRSLQEAADEVQKRAPETKKTAEEILASTKASAAKVAEYAKGSAKTASNEVQSSVSSATKKGQSYAEKAKTDVQGSEEGSGLLSPQKSETVTGSGPESEDKTTQDQILSSTQSIRPLDGDVDTDAMGKSGITVGEAKTGGVGQNYPDGSSK